MVRSRLGVALVALGVLGCAHRARGGDSAPPSAQAVAPLSHAMLGSASGSGLASSDALDRLFEAPEVTAAGDRLLSRLGEDPRLEPLYAETIDGVMRQPAMLQAFARLSTRDPSASIESIGDEVVARLSAGIEGPVFDAALDESLDHLLDRPTVDEAFGRMADVLIERSRLVEQLGMLMAQWAPELEVAVGVPLDDDRFGPRLEQHLGDPARAQALSSLLSARLANDPGLHSALAGLLDDEAFFGASAALVHGLLTSADFDANATDVLVGMIDEVDAQELRQRVDRVLVTPAVERAVVTWVDEVTTTAAFTTLAERLALVLEDPNLQAELFTIVVGAPAGPTA